MWPIHLALTLCFAVFPPCSWLRRLLAAAAASRRIPLLSFSLSSCPPPVCLYLDAKTNSYVEEFSTSNFIGVTKDGVVVTPTSDSILPSCTKGVVLQAARDLGLTVEQRPVSIAEVADLAEVAACGTAVVLTPIKSITHGSTVHRFEAFTTIAKLYDAVTGMQTGDKPDTQGLLRDVCERPHEAC